VALRGALHAEGISSVIKLGINKDQNTVNAHAWVETCGFEVLKNGTYNELPLKRSFVSDK
jgi:hypothetical protein